MKDEELIARLRHVPRELAKEAADRIEELVALRETAAAVVAESGRMRGQAEARAERLEAALRKLACKCPSNCDWERDDICPSWTARAALEGGAK